MMMLSDAIRITQLRDLVDNRVRPVRLASWSTSRVLRRQTAARSTDDAVCRSTQPTYTDQRGVVSRPFIGSRSQ